MKIYQSQNVVDAALSRIRYLFDEFEVVVVSFSGGKDSTIVLELALQVAEEKGRLPLPVMFLDQEAEWGKVINYVRSVMTDPRVEPMWFQMPFRLSNAMSPFTPFLDCWAEGEEWMRPKESYAIVENTYGVDRFHKLFPAISKAHWPDQSLAVIGGIRCAESNGRMASITHSPKYKWVTWGKRLHKDREHFNFYPIYDWQLSDVWKCIHQNNYRYSKVYDEFYRWGVQPHSMRVSSLHHESSVHQLFYLQEIEPDTWNDLVKRLGGINQAAHTAKSDLFAVKDLPWMFEDWAEYRDHLLENLIHNEDHRARMAKRFATMDELYSQITDISIVHKQQIKAILANDIGLVKIAEWHQNPFAIAYRKWKNGNLEYVKRSKYTKWIPGWDDQ